MTNWRVLLLATTAAACGSVTTASEKANEPTVTSLAPDHGSVVGGTMVTLTGTHLTSSGTPNVLVGGHLATMVTVTNDTTLTFMAPAGDEEGASVDVEVANANGFGTKTGAYTYNFQPLLLAVSPPNGKSSGGTAITITGRNFTMDSGMPTVTIGGAPATGVQIVDDKTITATTGPAAAGTPAFIPQDVVVTTANGSATLDKSFSVTKQGLIAISLTNTSAGTDQLIFVDPTNGAVATIATTGRHIHGCALNGSGVLYTMGMDGAGNSVIGSPRQLMTLDPLTGNTTLVGVLAEPGPPAVNRNPGSLTFVGNTLYATDSGQRLTAATHKLLTINPTDGALAQVGAAFTIGTNNAITTKDGANVYVADSTTTTLDTIAVATGVRTAGPAFSGGASDNVQGLVNTGSALYLAGRTNAIYTVNVGANAALVPLVTLSGVVTTVGLCQTPPTF